jgi:hypothetical protein
LRRSPPRSAAAVRTPSGARSRTCGEIFTPAGLGGSVTEPSEPYGAGPIPKSAPSPRQKLVLFTEHRDTLNYLERQIGSLLGRARAVVLIHGGMGREERRKAQESFLHDHEVQVLLATDAFHSSLAFCSLPDRRRISTCD